jgi:hypothetical protein
MDQEHQAVLSAAAVAEEEPHHMAQEVTPMELFV